MKKLIQNIRAYITRKIFLRKTWRVISKKMKSKNNNVFDSEFQSSISKLWNEFTDKILKIYEIRRKYEK